jgi:hypothetical protein
MPPTIELVLAKRLDINNIEGANLDYIFVWPDSVVQWSRGILESLEEVCRQKIDLNVGDSLVFKYHNKCFKMKLVRMNTFTQAVGGSQ